MLEISLLGRGGQGAFTAARLLGLSAAIHGGKQALAFPAFGPERRGAPVWAFVRIGDRPVRDRSRIAVPDWLVVLDETLLDQIPASHRSAASRILVNAPGGGGWTRAGLGQADLFRFDALPLAREHLGGPHVNTVMLGVLVSLSGCLEPAAVAGGLRDEFKPAAAARNQAAFEAAWRLAGELAAQPLEAAQPEATHAPV